jgi:hypothetical protein
MKTYSPGVRNLHFADVFCAAHMDFCNTVLLSMVNKYLSRNIYVILSESLIRMTNQQIGLVKINNCVTHGPVCVAFLWSPLPNCMLHGHSKIVQRCTTNSGALASEDSSTFAA